MANKKTMSEPCVEETRSGAYFGKNSWGDEDPDNRNVLVAQWTRARNDSDVYYEIVLDGS